MGYWVLVSQIFGTLAKLFELCANPGYKPKSPEDKDLSDPCLQ